MTPLVVVTMTSWKRRIQQVHLTVQQFMLNQTIRPNLFYIWLSEEEFPNKEKDLPQELLNAIKLFGLRLMWLKGNEYVFKRWKVFPVHMNDYVLAIDDDSYHSPTLIEDCLKTLAKYKNEKVICNVWRQFSAVPTYQNDIKINWKYENNSIADNIWWCGTSMIPPNTFPIEIFDDNDIVEFRKKYFPKNDEVMFNAYSVLKGIKKTFVQTQFPYLAFPNEKETAIATEQKKDDAFGYKLLEKNLYLMLKKLDIIDEYSKIYQSYNPEKFLSYEKDLL